MSYARFGTQGSDVYLYPSRNGLECAACPLEDYPDDDAPFRRTYRTRSVSDFREHLAKHRAAGHTVPAGVEGALAGDLEWLARDGVIDDPVTAAAGPPSIDGDPVGSVDDDAHPGPDEPPPGDTCQTVPVVVDGEPLDVIVHGTGTWSDKDRAVLGRLIESARRHLGETAALTTLVPLPAHPDLANALQAYVPDPLERHRAARTLRAALQDRLVVPASLVDLPDQDTLTTELIERLREDSDFPAGILGVIARSDARRALDAIVAIRDRQRPDPDARAALEVEAVENGAAVWARLLAQHGPCTCPATDHRSEDNDDAVTCLGPLQCPLCWSLPEGWPCPAWSGAGYGYGPDAVAPPTEPAREPR